MKVASLLMEIGNFHFFEPALLFMVLSCSPDFSLPALHLTKRFRS
jgi:hypothetical protein